MSDEEVVYALRWNNDIAMMIFALISYEYILHFEKEVMYVWTRRWSLMTYLYLATRYFGLFLAMLCACWGGVMYIPEQSCYDLAVLLEWGFSIYFWLAEVILIWRLYALYNQSKLILHLLIGSFLVIVALSIVIDIYLYSRPEAFSGDFQFLLGLICVQANASLYSDRDSNSKRQVLHGCLQSRAYVCDLCFYPDRVL